MLTTFLMMDDEVIKYLKRKTKNFFNMEPFVNFDSHQIENKIKPRKQKETNFRDVYVIDLEL